MIFNILDCVHISIKYENLDLIESSGCIIHPLNYFFFNFEDHSIVFVFVSFQFFLKTMPRCCISSIYGLYFSSAKEENGNMVNQQMAEVSNPHCDDGNLGVQGDPQHLLNFKTLKTLQVLKM